GFECLEREDDLGGIFNFGKPNSTIYKSTHLLSSKKTSEFPDFPMPREYPPCPHHSLVLDYFRSYAQHFQLYDHIRFNTSVERLEPQASGWRVRLGNGRERHYAGVIIANGHHWDPLYPDFPGRFDGRALHAKEYKSPEMFAGKRVLVVGAGNTACDIISDAVPGASRVFLSMRRPVHFLPKYTFGKPGDVTMRLMSRLGVPLWMQRILAHLGARVVNGDPREVGLPVPDHRVFDANVTVSSLVPFHVRQGDVTVKPNVESLSGSEVRFVDGTVEQVDVLVYATGYKVSFPFIDLAELNGDGHAPNLYLKEFHPVRDDLAVVGLFQSATGGHWPLMHFQAQVLARFLAARDAGLDLAWFQQLKQRPSPDLRGGFARLESERHRLTVEPVRFQRQLERLINEFERRYDLPVATPISMPDALGRRAA
ncbi:MAG: monooxygenase, partial [Planctomycetaceae bacterium]